MNTNHRLLELRNRLDRSEIDILIVTNLLNIRYLTGFSGSAGTLLVGSSARSKNAPSILLTDGRYAEQAQLQLNESGAQAEVVIGNALAHFEHAKRYVNGATSIGIEPDSTTLAMFDSWSKALEREVVRSPVKIEELRRFKDDDEIHAIRKACGIADEALRSILSLLHSEPTEAEFAAELEFKMRLLGADGPSFETIVASGANSAMPHARPTDRRMVEGDAVVIDFGAIWNGYHSDCTRTYFLGNSPSEQFSRIYQSVADSQLAGVAKAVLGEKASDVDKACRNHLSELGLEKYFTHSTGHGVGLEVHEMPWIHGKNEAQLEVGDVLTVEPGLYIPGEIGVRIEDTIAITRSGSECLTSLDKQPIIA